MEEIKIDVRLNTARVITQASHLRQRIIDTIGTITIDLQIELPAALHSLLTELTRLVQRLVDAVERLNGPGGPGGGGGGGAGGLLSNLKGIAAALLSVAAAQKIVESGVVMQQQENLLGARMGDLALGRELFNEMVTQANVLNVSAKQLSVTWNSFLPLAKNVGQLKQIVAWTDRLAKLDPVQGLEGATIAIKEIMSGETQSLVERFEISRGLANQLKEAAKLGDFDKLNTAMDKVFTQLKMSKEQVAALNAQPLNQLTGDLSQLGNHLSVFSKNIVGAVAETYVWFKQRIPNAIQTTVNLLSTIWTKSEPGLTMLTQGIGISGIAFMVYWFILILVNGTLIGMIKTYTQLAAAAIRSAVMAAASWVAAAWPLVLVIAIIVAAIATFVYFGGTVSEVVGFIVGTLFFLGAIIWEVIAMTLKLVINVVLLVGEAFMVLVAGAVKGMELVGDAIMDGLVYGLDLAGKGLNELITLLNLVPGVDIPNIPNVKELFGSAKPIDIGGNALWQATKDLDAFRNKASEAIPMVNPADAYKTGFGYGAGMTDSAIAGAGNLAGALKDKIGAGLQGFGDVFKVGDGVLDSTLIGGGIESVDEIGKIKDTVDISSEDLKTMRELADIQNIQNFVTLTPTVQVTTGDISQPTDVNEMIRQIEEVMVREVANSAQRVYS